MELRIGQGFDVHPVSSDEDRVLVLGGVTVPGARGLVGHSDADPVAHACIDALLGAAGLGDIGEHFPDTDPAHRDAESVALLAQVVAELAGEGWSVVNLDCTVITDRPKIAPLRAEMQARLAAVVGAPVSVKGKRTEGMGALAGGAGVACLAAVLISREGGR